MIKKDLVALVYATNSEYTEVLSVKDAEVNYKMSGFSVDIKRGVWNFDKIERQIAEKRACRPAEKWGVISIYNRKDDNHLSIMLSHARIDPPKPDEGSGY